MSDPTPITPTIKAFLNDALPGDSKQHALMLGESHDNISHTRFLIDHLDELAGEHRLGTIGHESSTLNNVFEWAYRDGALPVPPEQAVDYLKTLSHYTALRPEFHAALDAKVELNCKAIDQGMRVVHFDTRNGTSRKILKPDMALTKLRELFEEDPDLRIRMRTDASALSTAVARVLQRDPHMWTVMSKGHEQGQSSAVRDGLGSAFIKLEAADLLAGNRKYQRWMENYDAVILAGHKLGLSHDAQDAAILQAASDPTRNTLAAIGFGHLNGISLRNFLPGMHDKIIHGTFGQQLAKRMKTTTALMTDHAEFPNWQRSLRLDGDQIGMDYRLSNKQQFQLPPMLVTDEDRVMHLAELGSDQEPGSLEETLVHARDHHTPHAKPLVFVTEAKHVDAEQKKLDSRPMRDALSKLALR